MAIGRSSLCPSLKRARLRNEDEFEAEMGAGLKRARLRMELDSSVGGSRNN